MTAGAIDLHTHSTCSDGVLAPAQVVALAARAGLPAIALTDHDTTEGWGEAAAACAEHGLAFIPGLELSTEIGGRSVHILGYFVDATHAGLAQECDRLRFERERRAAAMVDKLQALGIPITDDEVLAQAGGAPVGRPHIAAAMVASGAVADLDAAFDQFLHDGGPAYVTKHALDPAEGVRLIAAAGGVAVLAHPGASTRDAPIDLALLDRLVAAGLAGVEADHVGHDEVARRYWREAAWQRNLYVTGSSDFHGVRDAIGVGAATTAPEVVAALRKLASSTATAGTSTTKEAPW